jgi:hypothetical protein
MKLKDKEFTRITITDPNGGEDEYIFNAELTEYVLEFLELRDFENLITFLESHEDTLKISYSINVEFR